MSYGIDRYFVTVVSVCAALASITGCGGGRNEQKDARLQYEPELNEVKAVCLQMRPFERQLVANGKLAAGQVCQMNFRSSGVVTDIFVENGAWVGKGTVIAAQDDREQQLALESARISLAQAELEYLDVLAGQGYSEGEDVPDNIAAMARMRSGYDAALNALRRAELDCEGTVVKAPFDGRVTGLKTGRYERSGSEPLCSLMDDRAMVVEFVVLESEYPFLEKGLPVNVVPYSGSGKTLEGFISGINPSVDKNGQVAVRAKVANDGSLINGMNVRVTARKTVRDMLVVPKSAVLIRDNMEVLFRYSGGKAHWTYVNVLMSNSTEYAVCANADRGAELSPGDTVIVSGNLNLADGSNVSLVK